jgi:sigma-B regulation protein RsbU (phosphoserine phosphatase)
MNGRDEEWGEEQLIQCVRQCGSLSAGEIMQRIIVGADTFVAGAKQHDDMTLIVAKLSVKSA